MPRVTIPCKVRITAMQYLQPAAMQVQTSAKVLPVSVAQSLAGTLPAPQPSARHHRTSSPLRQESRHALYSIVQRSHRQFPDPAICDLSTVCQSQGPCSAKPIVCQLSARQGEECPAGLADTSTCGQGARPLGSGPGQRRSQAAANAACTHMPIPASPAIGALKILSCFSETSPQASTFPSLTVL